eukprot:Gb_09932 [translate_table: standard]
MYRRFSKVELLKPTNKRFATYYILLEMLLQVKGALCAIVVNDMWAGWRQSTSDVVVEVRCMILDDHFCADVRFVVDLIEPVNDVIRFANTDSSCLGEIYECIDSMCERIKAITDARDTTLYPKLMDKIHGQWNKLNTPLHMATYALNPKWYDSNVTKKRPPSEDEVTNGFFTAVTKICGDGEEATLIKAQFAFFIRGAKEFGDLQSLRHKTNIKDPINWWTIHGRHAQELKTLATQLLA